MRLLRRLPGNNFDLTSFNDDHLPPYAILSHTWAEDQEVTYQELKAGIGRDKTGFNKILFCGEQAAVDGLHYFWVDTCCIDKSSSTELSTAINSMFRWYQCASRCYVYLSDISVPELVTDASKVRITWADAFQRSRWFTRGWTLQELVAPSSVEFFSREGKLLGSKLSLQDEIYKITRIPLSALRGQSLAKFSVKERMSWAALRATTMKEDRVYCLLGLFGVFMPPIYGEGEAHARRRLEEEIQKHQGQNHDISKKDVERSLQRRSSRRQPATSISVSNKHDIIRKSWGSRGNFQASYGLKPGDYEEGEAILEAMLKQDHSMRLEQSRKSRARFGDICFLCREPGHWSRDCPEICYTCGKRGHWSKDCFT